MPFKFLESVQQFQRSEWGAGVEIDPPSVIKISQWGAGYMTSKLGMVGTKWVVLQRSEQSAAVNVSLIRQLR